MESAPGRIVGREAELATVARFLDDPDQWPRALVLEGEAGIGKTTLWRAGLEAAAGAGYRVLVTRPGVNETMLSYSGLGDLLGEAFDEALTGAPDPQRRALEVALLRKRSGNLR